MTDLELAEWLTKDLIGVAGMEEHEQALFAIRDVGAAVAAIRRLVAENERLRGMLSWAAGALLDANDLEGHEMVMDVLEAPND